jgi:hypothetical protein
VPFRPDGRHPLRFLPTRSVCHRSFSPDDGHPINRFASIDFFTIQGSEHIQPAEP